MANTRWTITLLVLLTLVGVGIPAAWACAEGDDVVSLIDGELPGGG